MSVKKLLLNIGNSLGIKCSHKSVKSTGYNFCPDCGKKIIVRWISIKCRQCGHLRTTAPKNTHLIAPKKNFCCYCGSDKWGYQYYFDSKIPDKLRAISVKQIITEKENPFKNNNITASTNIWVEKPQTSEKNFKNNVIKANSRRN